MKGKTNMQFIIIYFINNHYLFYIDVKLCGGSRYCSVIVYFFLLL